MSKEHEYQSWCVNVLEFDDPSIAKAHIVETFQDRLFDRLVENCSFTISPPHSEWFTLHQNKPVSNEKK